MIVKYENPPSPDAIFAYVSEGIFSAVAAGDIEAAHDWIAVGEDLKLQRAIAAKLAPLN